MSLITFPKNEANFSLKITQHIFFRLVVHVVQGRNDQYRILVCYHIVVKGKVNLKKKKKTEKKNPEKQTNRKQKSKNDYRINY